MTVGVFILNMILLHFRDSLNLVMLLVTGVSVKFIGFQFFSLIAKIL